MKSRAPYASISNSFSSGAVYEFATKMYFRSSVTAFPDLAHNYRHHCELHTTECEIGLNYQQLLLRRSH